MLLLLLIHCSLHLESWVGKVIEINNNITESNKNKDNTLNINQEDTNEFNKILNINNMNNKEE